MFSKVFIISIFLIPNFVLILNNFLCEEYETKMNHNFYPLKFCQKSTGTIIRRANYTNITKCFQLARGSGGLAVNFSPYNFTRKSRNGTDEFCSCEILECPEFENFTGMTNDSRYDHYSLFTNPMPPINTSCVPGVGIFFLHINNANYSQAANICKKNGGVLADILSEARTNGLSNILLDNNIKMAYIGLNDETKSGEFLTSWKDPISCFTYRAWAPGHPRDWTHGEICVALDNKRLWRTVSCEKKLPFLCEILGNGPYQESNPYGNVTCSQLSKREERRKCHRITENIKKRANRRIKPNRKRICDIL